MSAGQPTPWPQVDDDRLADDRHGGHMARWAEPSATVASFGFEGAGSRRRIKVANATASVAGALTAADYALLHSMQAPVLRLSYAPASNLLNGAAISASTWTDVSTNQNFTVGSATAQLIVSVRMHIAVTGASATELGARILFNSGGTPVPVWFAGDVTGSAGGWGGLGGGGFWLPAAYLPAGTNTVKVQLFANGAVTAYLRASSQPDIELFALQIVEMAP